MTTDNWPWTHSCYLWACLHEIINCFSTWHLPELLYPCFDALCAFPCRCSVHWKDHACQEADWVWSTALLHLHPTLVCWKEYLTRVFTHAGMLVLEVLSLSFKKACWKDGLISLCLDNPVWIVTSRKKSRWSYLTIFCITATVQLSLGTVHILPTEWNNLVFHKVWELSVLTCPHRHITSHQVRWTWWQRLLLPHSGGDGAWHPVGKVSGVHGSPWSFMRASHLFRPKGNWIWPSTGAGSAPTCEQEEFLWFLQFTIEHWRVLICEVFVSRWWWCTFVCPGTEGFGFIWSHALRHLHIVPPGGQIADDEESGTR